MIEEIKTKFSLSYACLARQLGLSYTTLMRWRRRLAEGLPAVGKRGPKKVQPLNLSELREKIQGLDHGSKRSRGTAALHGAYSTAISRREFNEMVRQVRSETRGRRAAEGCRVSWLRPNLAWAMDDCRKSATSFEAKLHLHNVSDLCSRYKLPPIASGYLPCGNEIAGHLEHLFNRFGAPLFCKRDNGGNLNHTAVDEVMEQALVVPVNSPANTAPYNGAIERTQGEFKGYLGRWHYKANTIDELSLLAETAAHDLNHKPRRCLRGRTSCTAFFSDTRLRYSKRQRSAIYRWIRDLASEISIRAGKDAITPVAWRVAAKRWLIENGLIKIVKAGKVSPRLSSKLCHN